ALLRFGLVLGEEEVERVRLVVEFPEVLQLEAEHQRAILLELPQRIIDESFRIGGGQNEAIVGVPQLESILHGCARVEVVANRAEQAPAIRQLQAGNSENVLLVGLLA